MVQYLQWGYVHFFSHILAYFNDESHGFQGPDFHPVHSDELQSSPTLLEEYSEMNCS